MPKQKEKNKQSRLSKGVSLIEMLIVIVIVTILFGAAIIYARDAWEKSKIRRAVSDLNAIRLAMTSMEYNKGSGVIDLEQNKAVDIARGGICKLYGDELWIPSNTPELVPYLPDANMKDPWGREYQFDADYCCYPGIKGCEEYVGYDGNTSIYCPDGNWVRAIISHGPNLGVGTEENGHWNSYDDGDNIVLVLCNNQ